MNEPELQRVRATLKHLDVPAWLLYSFRDTNPISQRMLGLTPEVHQSRRWAYLIPAEGEPRGLVHRIEPHIGKFMRGEVRRYSSHEEFESGIAWLLDDVDQVAMEYSHHNMIPVVSRVDAGTVEMVRSTGTDVVSSGALIAMLEARLSARQIESAMRAGVAVREIMMSAFRFIRERILASSEVNEYDVQQEILRELDRRGLDPGHPPIVGVGPHSADPHYEPVAEGSSTIARGDLVLVDLWGRELDESGVYGDITWVGVVDTSADARHSQVFDVVCRARESSLAVLREAFSRGREVSGADLDRAARDLITGAGYGDAFVHRTGHSITGELHGAGANLDSYETIDTRPILSATSFSIEPGIYLEGDFGIRSELDVVIDQEGTIHVPSEPLQNELVMLLA